MSMNFPFGRSEQKQFSTQVLKGKPRELDAKIIMFIFKKQHHTALLCQTVTNCQPFFAKKG